MLTDFQVKSNCTFSNTRHAYMYKYIKLFYEIKISARITARYMKEVLRIGLSYVLHCTCRNKSITNTA